VVHVQGKKDHRRCRRRVNAAGLTASETKLYYPKGPFRFADNIPLPATLGNTPGFLSKK
jgi:hypothetical protein